MEEKGETVNGPMLKAKWSKFEEQFDVPKLEHLPGNGWILPFCKAYGLKEHCWHWEAGSVDLQAVEEEHKWQLWQPIHQKISGTLMNQVSSLVMCKAWLGLGSAYLGSGLLRT